MNNRILIALENVNIKKDNKYILRNINLSFYTKDRIVGLIGENGAGKTSLIKSILGFIPISSGKISIQEDIKISYCPDIPYFDEYLTAVDLLSQSMSMAGIKIDKYYIKEILNEVGLKSLYNSNQLVNKMSRGMRQKLNIACSIVQKPKILILDEPTSALDPESRFEIIELIKKLKESMHIIISGHQLSDIEKLSDRIIMMKNGNIILNNKTENILIDDEKYICVKFKNSLEPKIFNTDNMKNVLLNILEVANDVESIFYKSKTLEEIFTTLNVKEEEDVN